MSLIPLAEKIHTLKDFDPALMFVKFQLSGSDSFLDMRGSQIYSRGSCAPYTPPGGKKIAPEKCT